MITRNLKLIRSEIRITWERSTSGVRSRGDRGSSSQSDFSIGKERKVRGTQRKLIDEIMKRRFNKTKRKKSIEIDSEDINFFVGRTQRRGKKSTSKKD